MATKVSLEDLENVISSLIDPIVRATKQAQWDGIGGVSSYLTGGRLDILEKKYGTKAKLGALKILFENIATATINAFDPLVLKKFAESNFEVIKAYAKENPTFFAINADITNICRSALPPKERKHLERLLSDSQKALSAEASL